jgi:hypothetical protein
VVEVEGVLGKGVSGLVFGFGFGFESDVGGGR